MFTSEQQENGPPHFCLPNLAQGFLIGQTKLQLGVTFPAFPTRGGKKSQRSTSQSTVSHKTNVLELVIPICWVIYSGSYSIQCNWQLSNFLNLHIYAIPYDVLIYVYFAYVQIGVGISDFPNVYHLFVVKTFNILSPSFSEIYITLLLPIFTVQQNTRIYFTCLTASQYLLTNISFSFPSHYFPLP